MLSIKDDKISLHEDPKSSEIEQRCFSQFSCSATIAMLNPIVSAEARKFCETTSVRGVPRIVKSKTRFLSIIWLMGVVTCGGVLIWQVVIILKRYNRYPVNTQILQAPAGMNPTFPDVTVCNLCPMIHVADFSLSYPDYVSILSQQLTHANFMSHLNANLSISRIDYDQLMGMQFQSTNYFRNLPIVNSENGESRLDNLTIDCRYFNWDYSENTFKCMSSISSIWNPDYYKCYTVKLADSQRQNVRGFSAIYYVADFIDNQLSDFNLDLTASRATGLRVVIHEPNTIPNMKLGVSVTPGTETTIKLDQNIRKRLPYPYSNCTAQKTLGLSAYTQQYCLEVCLQDQALIYCGCILEIYQYTQEQLEESNYTICGNLSLNDVNSTINWNGFNQQICSEMFQPNYDICYVQCTSKCSEYQYSQQTSSAPWPHISNEASFYFTHIRGKFGDMFDSYEKLLYYLSFNKTEAIRILQQLDQKGLIKNHFLQLNVVYDSSTYSVHQDVATFPVDAMGAQIGGVLSLWLGVTVMLFFEICEFLYTLVTQIWYKAHGRVPAAVISQTAVPNPENSNSI